MKKLYNKALLYQYYHSGRWALLLGSGAFAFFTYMFTSEAIDYLKIAISSLNGDKFYHYGTSSIIVELVILLLIYMIITGKNKRNNLTFLTSGPYSKEDIKRNQIIFLIISLLTLIIIYIYINLCLFYRERELLSLAESSISILFRDTLKLFVCGLAFISYLVLMDTLFSSSGITMFLIILTPIVFIVDLVMISYLADFFKSYTIFSGKFGAIISSILVDFRIYIFETDINFQLLFRQEIYIMILILFATAIAFALAWLINKKLIINNINKLFNFLIVEKIFYWVFSFSILLVICTISASIIRPNYLYFEMERTTKGTISILILIVVISIISTISERMIRKLIKKFI